MKTKLLQYCNARARSLQGGGGCSLLTAIASPLHSLFSRTFSTLLSSLDSLCFTLSSTPLSLLPSQNIGQHGGNPGNPRKPLVNPPHFLQDTLRVEFKNTGKRGGNPGNPRTLGIPNTSSRKPWKPLKYSARSPFGNLQRVRVRKECGKKKETAKDQVLL